MDWPVISVGQAIMDPWSPGSHLSTLPVSSPATTLTGETSSTTPHSRANAASLISLVASNFTKLMTSKLSLARGCTHRPSQSAPMGLPGVAIR